LDRAELDRLLELCSSNWCKQDVNDWMN